MGNYRLLRGSILPPGINTYYRVDTAYLRGNEGKHLVKRPGIETLSEESANRLGPDDRMRTRKLSTFAGRAAVDRLTRVAPQLERPGAGPRSSQGRGLRF
jgi:hypothetical protein